MGSIKKTFVESLWEEGFRLLKELFLTAIIYFVKEPLKKDALRSLRTIKIIYYGNS